MAVVRQESVNMIQVEGEFAFVSVGYSQIDREIEAKFPREPGRRRVLRVTIEEVDDD